MFAATAQDMADPMAELRQHRILSRALSDLGQYALAHEHVELALQPSRGAMPPTKLNAYDIDDWVAARAMRARILWLRGYPDDANIEAEQCVSEALRLGHRQSTCWALAFNVCPITIWRGDFVAAQQFVTLLREHSHGVFQHYHEWSSLYEQFLNGIAATPDRRKEPRSIDLQPKVLAQADLLATFDVALLGPETLTRAQADEDIWCAPEILRAWAHRLTIGADSTARADPEQVLTRSLDIARRHGAKAWELRTATTLALLYRDSGRVSQGRATLEPVLEQFTQGQGTKDIQVAANLLLQLHE
jgi:hypothetical protein